MRVVLERVLTPDEIVLLRTQLSERRFLDGRATSEVAGKHNLQLTTEDPVARSAGEFVTQRLATHERFHRTAYPAAIIAPMFSRYARGMEYPQHIDRAIIGQGRADVSVTLFLSDPSEYDGGDLEIDTGNGERRYRLPAGDAVAYPSTMLHRVSPVTRGVREVVVMWVQSMVRSAERRQILAELGDVARELPSGPYGDRVRRSHANLERMWLEP
jgi:PKHD-type hydroxylase